MKRGIGVVLAAAMAGGCGPQEARETVAVGDTRESVLARLGAMGLQPRVEGTMDHPRNKFPEVELIECRRGEGWLVIAADTAGRIRELWTMERLPYGAVFVEGNPRALLKDQKPDKAQSVLTYGRSENPLGLLSLATRVIAGKTYIGLSSGPSRPVLWVHGQTASHSSLLSRTWEVDDLLLLSPPLRKVCCTRGGFNGMEAAGSPELPPDPLAELSSSHATITTVHGSLAAINAGSDRGIMKGMRMVIFRGLEYIAMLQIEIVEKDSATGVVVDKKHNPLIHDRVVPRLPGAGQ